jgi:septation ring formation regulator EzrA
MAGKQMNYGELIRLGFVALKEAFKFIKENQSSVNIEQRMNELEGDIYALQGYTEKLVLQLNDEKAGRLQAENKVRELQHEIDGLNKYFKGE